MTKVLLVGVALALVLLAVPAQAQAKMGCKDLAVLSQNLRIVMDYLQDGSIADIQEGDEVDLALKDMIDGLKDLSLTEGDRELTDLVDDLEAAWTAMNGEAFLDALDGVEALLKEIYEQDCL